MINKIIKVLKKHVGMENAIPVHEIANIVGIYDSDFTNPKLRFEIKKIIDELDIPIGSCREGYFIIANEKELELCISDYLHRINGIKKRIRSLRYAFQEYY
jgi:hypothetical protein